MSLQNSGRERNVAVQAKAADSQHTASPRRLSVVPNRGYRGIELPQAKCRSLLALDGDNLTPDLLDAAVNKCMEVADRVDILLVNPPAAPTTVLCELLIKLEQAGIDYRLTTTSGKLPELVGYYLRRFLGVTLIMVATLQVLGANWRVNVADLRHQGYRFLTLSSSSMD